MNKKGQMGMGYIMGIVMLVISVLLITSFWPIIQNSFDGLRHQDELNCVSTTDVCGGVGSNSTCYNASVGNSHTTVCAMLSLGPPLILIMLILGAVALLMSSGSSAPQPQYPGY